MKLKALLLDLDGTLVDTAPDMVGTLNRLLRNHGQAPADQHTASKLVSNGARALIEFGFAKPLEEARSLDLIEQFLSDYAEHVADQSKVYTGMSEVLDLCTENRIVWGVITNKPLELSRALLEGLGLFDRCSILLGGDSLPVKKPDPAPMLHSCMVLNLAPSECLYVGDHERDILAGRNAGMDTAAALWGYINEDQSPADWGASYMLNEPSGLMQLVREKIASKR
jgi:2-phosphoglycolate phosphatase